MKLLRRMEWPEPRNLTSIEELSGYTELLYKTLTEESALRAVELDVAFTDGYNVVLGHEAGTSLAISLDDTEGIYNVFLGHQAGYSNTTGIKNIAIGYAPLYTNTTGVENTALGSEALYSNTSGANNVALGNDALYTNATGSYNVAVGFEALKVSTASNNVAIGYQALVANTSGANNIALGYQTLDANSTGAGNVAIGESALTVNTTASFNLAIGYNALASNTDGHTNVAIGHSALTGNTSADYNVAIGYQALDASNTGDKNIAIGFGCLGTNTSGYENVATGYNALTSNTQGYQNVAMGSNSSYSNTTSYKNIAIGYNALYSQTTPGGNNIAIGWDTGEDCTGSANTYIGAVAGQYSTSGDENVCIGSGAGQGSDGNSTYSDNVLIGVDAGASLTTGSGNIFIGYQAAYTRETTGSNKLYIENSSSATPLIYGEFDNNIVAIHGSLGIGTATPGTNKMQFATYDTATTLRIEGTSSALAKAAISIGGYGEFHMDAPGVGAGRFKIDDAGNVTMGSATSTITGGTAMYLEAGASGIKSATIHGDTTANAGDVEIADSPSFVIRRSTSSQKYKDKVGGLELDSSLIYNLRPVSFNSLCDSDKKDKRYIGLIAEEIEQIYPEIIKYNEHNKAESYDNQMLMTLMLSEIQNQNKRIEALEAA